jgi:hypothetical protein
LKLASVCQRLAAFPQWDGLTYVRWVGTSMNQSKGRTGERFQWEAGNLAFTWLQLHLRCEPGWRINKILHGRTAIVAKMAPFVVRDWRQQATVVARSWLPQAWRKFTTSIQMLVDPMEVTGTFYRSSFPR